MAGSDYRRMVAGCCHERPLFPTTGRQRAACYGCVPKVTTGRPRKTCEPRDKTPKQCLDCGADFIGVPQQRYCCDACRVRAGNAAASARAAAVFVPETRKCRHCGSSFTINQRQRTKVFCSNECKKRDAWRRLCNGNTHIRRAKRMGRQWEYFDKRQVFARDGWRCQLCGVRTPNSLSGTDDPRAPELDHIVPLSAGGHHVMSNTQCACKACNGRKRTKPLGQLRMF